jgi:protein-disulfide isomerase
MKYIPRFIKTPQGKFVFVIAIILGVLFGYYFFATSNTTATNDTTADIVISATDHVRGAKDAKVTLVEFGDFQCPACAAYESVVKQVLSDNPDTVKLVYKHFPLTQIHRNALPAAKATEAAGLQGKFWEMHDMLYAKQDEWSGALNSRDYFLTYATTLGLDTKKFLADYDNAPLEEKILAEFREGVKLGVQGTPTFFVNGKKLENVRDLAGFDKAIKEAALSQSAQ